MGSDVQWRTRERARWGTFCFTITLGRTLLLRLKTSSPHVSGNKLTTPRTTLIWRQVIFHLFLHLKKLLGSKRFDDDIDLIDALQKWLTSQAAAFYDSGYKNLCPATISATIMAENMWENSLKNVESDNNKILFETLLDFFLQRSGTYFLNNPRTLIYSAIWILLVLLVLFT